jgi:uncharacterized protein YegL
LEFQVRWQIASVVVAAPPSAPAASTTLAITGERAACARGIEQKMLAMLSLKAPPAPDDSWKRPPMDLVACIDRSGSMRGEKMKLMKQTLDLLVRRTGLTAEDRLALVTFDSNVRCDMSLVPMSNAGRTQAEGVVRGLQPGSTTNLSGGALKAIDVLDESAGGGSRKGDKAKDEPKRTRAVMLFTDGLANEGIRDTTQLVAAVNGALAAASAKLGGPISLFTFGFGADHNEDCLRGLAAGSGAAGMPSQRPNTQSACAAQRCSRACDSLARAQGSTTTLRAQIRSRPPLPTAWVA